MALYLCKFERVQTVVDINYSDQTQPTRCTNENCITKIKRYCI